jgi:hypothetical protein
MLKQYLIICLLSIANLSFAQTNAKKTIQAINKKFLLVNSYEADVDMLFNIPSVKMTNLQAKFYYKRPDKFKMKSKGVFFLPKQNPIQNISKLLLDTLSYTAVQTGEENINGVLCKIINVIPTKSMGDFIMGKFWIAESAALIYKSEITTKNGGTLNTQNTFGKYANLGLPDAIEIIMDVNKFKIPKLMAMDINRKKNKAAEGIKKETANIKLVFKNYKINSTIDDNVFIQKAE